jgi:hypothetical protein
VKITGFLIRFFVGSVPKNSFLRRLGGGKDSHTLFLLQSEPAGASALRREEFFGNLHFLLELTFWGMPVRIGA